MFFEHDTIDIGLGVFHPALSNSSLNRLRDFRPTYDPGADTQAILFPHGDIRLSEDEKGKPLLLDAGCIPICSGTLFELGYPGYLNQEEIESLVSQIDPTKWLDLGREGDLVLRIYWSLTRYSPHSRMPQMKYRFVWGFRSSPENSFCLLSDQLFAAETTEPWFHVQLDFKEHTARLVLGIPIAD